MLTRADGSFADRLGAFLAELRARRYTDSLVRSTQHVVPRLIDYLEARRIKDPRAVTEAHLVAFLRRLARRRTRYGRPPVLSTQALYVTTIRRFFAFLARRGYVLADPARGIALPRVDSLPRVVLNVTQARRLMNAPSPPNPRWWAPAVEQRDRAILETLYGTGIRLSECLWLDVADIDLAQGRLWVRNGKGRRDRVAPIPARAAEALDVYLRDARPLLARGTESALFVAYQRGKRMSKGTLRVLLHQKARRAGLSMPVTPHVLRHSCATHLLQGGADVRHVQELLGHTHIDSTTRYTRVAIKDLKDVVARAHPREKQWKRRAGRA